MSHRSHHELRADRSRRRARSAVACALLLVGAACSKDAVRTDSGPGGGGSTPSAEAKLPAPVQTLDIVGTEYSFELDPAVTADLRPGWTEVRFDNAGAEAHQVMFARLKDGVDMTELAAAGAGDSSGASAIEFVDMIGGVSYIGPGQEITAMVELSEGTVIAMCYVPDADGVAHALMGMTTLLTVAAPDTPDGSTPGSTSPAAPPDDVTVVGTIDMAPGGYLLPDEVVSGWYHVVNTDTGEAGRGLHELSIMRLERALDEAELDQLLADIAVNATPSVELEALGGLGAISPGFDGYLYLDLPAGEYVAVDFMPDARDPRPHLLDGYATAFTVG